MRFAPWLLVVGIGCSSPPPPTIAVPPASTVDVGRTADPLPLAVPVDAGPPERGASEGERALAEWSTTSQCTTFDYFPRGGIQSFWCHRPQRLGVESVRALAGVDILASTQDFGHYNPAFVKWLVETAGPSPRGSLAQKATQGSYDANLRPLAGVFWKTLEKIRREPDCFLREKTAYGDAIAKKRLPKDHYDRWYYFMNPYFCDAAHAKDGAQFYSDNGGDGGGNGNVAKTVVGFWLRRALDGTMDAFADGLQKLIASYEPALAESKTKPANGAAITKALEAGMKNVSACKDPKAKRPSSGLTISVGGDGHITAHAPVLALGGPSQATCIEAAFSGQTVPPFDGQPLVFRRPIFLR